MTTLIFRAKMREGKEDEALARLSAMCAAVEANEPDTLAYVFHRSQDDPSQAVLFESYASPEALQAHMETPHMAELRTAFGELFDMSQVNAERMDPVAGFSRGQDKAGVTVIFRVKTKDGKTDQAVSTMRGMVEQVQAQEPGAVIYAFHHPTEDPSEIVFYEAYADDDVFKNHMGTPHMNEMRAGFAEAFDPSTAKMERLDRVAGFARATS